MNLREIIAQEIRERGPMKFSRYMELCLYHPVLGYYSRDAQPFGKAGDFYTSSDVHAVFGRLLSRQFEEIWRMMGSPERIELIEFGPGRGLFAHDVLDWSERKFPGFFSAMHYSLAEQSPSLRAKLQQTLKNRFEAGKASIALDLAPERRCEDRPALPRQSTSDSTNQSHSEDRVTRHNIAIPRILFANEFFDAFPVEIVSTEGSLHISLDEDRLREVWLPASTDELEFLDRYGVHPESGERMEVPLAAQRHISELVKNLETTVLIVIDYGYTRPEQLAGFHRGTLMTFRRHMATANPYEAPGEQDITAHVNFTALVAELERNGLQVQPLLTQAQFLLGIGERNQFADVFDSAQLPQERAKRALQLKHLITPEGMGETFRVLVASKGVQNVGSFSGLSFNQSRI